MDSVAPVAAKAQHDPHYPWFLGPWRCPVPLQSTEAGEETASSCGASMKLSDEGNLAPFNLENSAEVQSENWLTPL